MSPAEAPVTLELVPLSQAASNTHDGHHRVSNDDDDGHSDSDIADNSQRSSASTLFADDLDPKQAASRIHSLINRSSKKAIVPRNLPNGESILEEQEGERLITDNGERGKKPQKRDEGPVGWRSLPHKGQLAVLTLARLSEPLVQTSLQLKSFDETLPASTIATQAGIMQSSFTAAQFLTAIAWGRFADSDRGGRKTVLLIGLLGTLTSCVGFGFSKSFWQALLFRSMGGAQNGNVGVMRTMISEIVKEKKFQSRAFILLPMCFNVGVIIGPILGGLLADPAGSYPDRFGKIGWLVRYPYAPPNLLSAFFLLSAVTAVFFGLDETLDTLRHRRDIGRIVGRKVAKIFRRRRHHLEHVVYTPLDDTEQIEDEPEQQRDIEMSPTSIRRLPKFKAKLPFRRIFTTNVICTLIAHGLLAMHVGTFNNLWFVFLSTPVYPTSDERTIPIHNNNHNDTTSPTLPLPPHYREKPPFIFTGGLGMPPTSVGLAMAILGFIGINLQLWIYPLVNAKIGTIRSWRLFLYCFPISYIIAPYLSIIPSRSPPPHEKDGFLIWFCMCCVLCIQVIGRTFALPASTILLNNCSPHPSVLGTIHGIGHSVSSAARTVGPVFGGWAYGVGLRRGVVGVVWWILAGVAGATVVASGFVREGDGHEIVLEGDVVVEEQGAEQRRRYA